MNEVLIHPSTLSGHLNVPPSKSHTQRALLFASLGSGKSRIDNVLSSPDIEVMLRAISLFGAQINRVEASLEIDGHFSEPSDIIDAGNSGQVLRFMAAISALLPANCEITGDASIRKRRPIKPLLAALRQLGAIAESARGDGYAPVLIRGPIQPGSCHLSGEDSQPVSALLMALSFLKGPSEIFVQNPGETPWIDLTLHWLTRLGANITHHDYAHYKVQGSLQYERIDYLVPGDFSTAAFPIAAALVTHSSLKLTGLDEDDIQGDKAVIPLLQAMGANIAWQDKTLVIEPSSLTGINIDVNVCVDALPILAVIGCFAEGITTLYNGAIARNKESDRISAICQELKKMGAQIEERPDGLVIHKSSLQGATVEGHRDHRIALSLCVAALGAQKSSIIQGVSWIEKSYPTFIDDFISIGAEIELDLVRI